MEGIYAMSASDLQSLRDRLDGLAKRAGASVVLAEMLHGQVARQEQEINAVRWMLAIQTLATISADQESHQTESLVL